MKMLLGLLSLTLITSCGKVESPDELFDFLDHDKISKQVNNNSKDINKLQKKIDEIKNSLNLLYSQVDNFEADQDIIEQSIALLNSNILILENKTTVKRLIDPCGDNPNNFDEKLIELSSGEIIAYFEQGSKRFLTSLSDGNYRTTDAQRCNFQIVNGNYTE